MLRLSPWSVGILLGYAALTLASSKPTQDVTDFDWESIIPSTDLKYHDCYTGFQCARVVLPMDWLDDTNQENVTIAVTKRPAIVDEADPSFGGTIFAQPGGPGASGTLYGLGRAKKYQQHFDKPGKKHYEILSFDPRGIGHSTPKIDCFPGILSYLRGLERITAGSLDLSPEALDFSVAAAKADGSQCEKVHGKFLSYVGTPNVVRDMVAILDKIEELRQRNSHNGDDSRLELRSDAPEDLARLQYIGVSYGTTIGQFFASMFPGRVGRMILDGVTNAEEASNGLEWLDDGQDLDKIVELFFQGCYDAGQSVCALCREDDASGSDISRRVWEWADNLDEYPLVGILVDGNRIFIRAGDIRGAFFQSSYSPLVSWQNLASTIDKAMQGNITSLVAQVIADNQLSPPQGNLGNYSNNPMLPFDAIMAVFCADGVNLSDQDNSFWSELLQKHLAISSIAGALYTNTRLLCAGWKAQPNWSFKGPFKSPEPTKQGEALDPERPAAPILFASTRYDPATPLSGARDMMKNHPRSGLLIQETIGHCVILGELESCSRDVMAEYFDTGAVPDGELLCKSTHSPWDRHPNPDIDGSDTV